MQPLQRPSRILWYTIPLPTSSYASTHLASLDAAVTLTASGKVEEEKEEEEEREEMEEAVRLEL